VSASGAAPLKVALCGGKGRMGLAIRAIAEREPDRFSIVGLLRREEDATGTLAAADVIIDFSRAAATPSLLTACRAAGKPLVLGTTGHDATQRAAITEAAREIGVVFAANFSVGVNALFWLTREAARILGPGFDLEVVEMHHRLKKDAPSGTARRLAEILAAARALDYTQDAVHGRHGLIGERDPQEIGVHAIRGGDIVGEHTVLFAAAGERLELTHRAGSRETFAAGALRAAAWLTEKSAGLYDMEDVLGLTTAGGNF
jgi:4-hydroxy-tetrahydrodipicolinate reductase